MNLMNRCIGLFSTGDSINKIEICMSEFTNFCELYNIVINTDFLLDD